MENLPEELENIIMDYKYQMEHQQRFQLTLDEINQISYTMNGYDSWRSYGSRTVQYYGGFNEVGTLYDTEYELWIHTYETTPPYMNGDIGEEFETTTTIYESINSVYITMEIEQRGLIDIDDVPADFQYHSY